MSTKAVTVGYGQYRFTLTNVSEADDNADVACMCGEYTVGNDRAILTVISKILENDPYDLLSYPDIFEYTKHFPQHESDTRCQLLVSIVHTSTSSLRLFLDIHCFHWHLNSNS